MAAGGRDREGLLGALLRSGRPLGEEVERAVVDLESRLVRLDAALEDVAAGEGLPPGFTPERYLLPGVPRIRPVLVLLASQAAGGAAPDVTDAALSAEMLHTALRVHDAALGRQGGRRRRVARRLLGSAASWLGGNHLSLRALELARAAGAPEILGDLLDTLREVAEVQALAEQLRDRDATEEDWREYAEGHTGAVFSFCTRAGSHLAGAPREVVGALGRYGRHVGVAWMGVEDQWLFDQPGEVFVRLLAMNASNGRPLMPLVRAMALDSRLDSLVDRVLAEGELDPAEELRSRVVASGAVRTTHDDVVAECLLARRTLSSVPESPHTRILDRIASTLAVSGRQLVAPTAAAG